MQMTHSFVRVLALTVCAVLPTLAAAQQRGAPPPALAPRAAALIDVTGYWVAIVDQDWRWRMITAPVGDVAGIPVNAAGRKLAEAWDPAKDQADGKQCKAYGAGGLMRIPTRLHIYWTDDATLAIDTDAGQQQRLLHFGGTPQGEASLQGYSAANWYKEAQKAGFGPPTGLAQPGKGGTLKITTSHLSAGYLRTNGVPYSEQTTMVEWLDRVDDEGLSYLVLTSVVKDPMYLSDSYVTSYEFKREPDAAKWHPQPCRIIPPPVKPAKLDPGTL
jgi:hypothetical protein